MARFRQMCSEEGRNPLPVSLWGRTPDYEELVGYRDLGAVRVCTSLDSAKEDEIFPVLDKWAGIIRWVNGQSADAYAGL